MTEDTGAQNIKSKSNQAQLIQDQNILLKALLRAMVEMMPKHSEHCRVHRMHPHRGDDYCDCEMKQVKTELRKLK